jgi:hypothetical protein
VNLQCWISSNSLYFPISRSNGCKDVEDMQLIIRVISSSGISYK